MQLLQKLLTYSRVAFVLRYRRGVGVSFIVLGLFLSLGVGVQLAFYEKPMNQKSVLGASVQISPTEQVPIALSPQPTAEITYGPPLPATRTGSLTPSTITPTEIPTITPTPRLTNSTPIPTNIVAPPNHSTSPSTVSSGRIGSGPTATPTLSVLPTITITPTPSSPITVIANTDDAVWDKLAQCESTGHWDDNTGNGYFGGLQFSQGTWESVGGTGNPAQASREEQIMRGKMLQQRRGWGPWGGCSAKLGL
jgi:hypothetical protein